MNHTMQVCLGKAVDDTFRVVDVSEPGLVRQQRRRTG